MRSYGDILILQLIIASSSTTAITAATAAQWSPSVLFNLDVKFVQPITHFEIFTLILLKTKNMIIRIKTIKVTLPAIYKCRHLKDLFKLDHS